MAAIEFRHLEHFLAVVDTGSFKGAARQVHISQPAITKSIQRMEEWFEQRIFDRNPTLELTDFGKLLLKRARSTAMEFKDLHHEVDLFRNLDHGEVTIGVGPLPAETLMGPVIGSIIRQHPNVRIAMVVKEYNQFIEPLLRREIDLFVADTSELKEDDSLQITKIPKQEAVWYCRLDHPLAKKKQVTLEELSGYPIVVPTLPKWAIDWYEANREKPSSKNKHPESIRPTVTCSHLSTLKAIVSNSDSVCGTIKPAIQREVEAKQFAILPLKATPLYSNTGIVFLKNRTLSPIAQLIHDRILAFCATPEG